MSYRTIIVDDEPNSSSALQTLLEMYCPELKIAAVFNDSRKALEYLLAEPADLVFLDIQMPHLTGIELLQKFNAPKFHAIFTTAYDQFAIDAIKLSALDYLLKPIDPDNLKSAVQRFIQKKLGEDLNGRDHVISNNGSSNKRLVINLQNKTLFVNIDEILYLEADSNYTNFHMMNGKSFITSKTIKYYENEIGGGIFFRPHQSYLVNTKCIQAYSRVDNALVLSNDKLIPVSKNKKDQLLGILMNG